MSTGNLWKIECAPEGLHKATVHRFTSCIFMGEALRARALLSSGYLMPRVGYGTYQLHGSDVHKSVRAALGFGYQLVDTSTSFHNESMIRLAFGSIRREAVFLQMRIAYGDRGVNEPRTVALRSIDRLKSKYVDLLLLEGAMGLGTKPTETVANTLRLEAWQALEDLVREGKTRSIGVSAFNLQQLKHLMGYCSLPISVVQTELHPLNYDEELVQFCYEHKIVVQAFSPLARGRNILMQNPVIKEAAESLRKTIPQIALRWALQKGLSFVTKSSNLQRIKYNVMLDFEIPAEVMERIDSINTKTRVGWGVVD